MIEQVIYGKIFEFYLETYDSNNLTIEETFQKFQKDLAFGTRDKKHFCRMKFFLKFILVLQIAIRYDVGVNLKAKSIELFSKEFNQKFSLYRT